MPKPSPEQIWQRLVDEAGEDEVERAASVRVAQAEKDLAEAGFDVAAERAKATALLAELGSVPPVSGKVAIAGHDKPTGAGQVRRMEPAANVVSPVVAQARASTRLVWLVAALLAGLALFLALRKNEPPPVAQPRPESSQQRAADFRDEAVVACDRHAWSQCLELLNEARALDPEGDRAERVQDLRRAAQHGLVP
jgi:hypothetical protein